jgi:hypothetical protein
MRRLLFGLVLVVISVAQTAPEDPPAPPIALVTGIRTVFEEAARHDGAIDTLASTVACLREVQARSSSSPASRTFLAQQGSDGPDRCAGGR